MKHTPGSWITTFNLHGRVIGPMDEMGVIQTVAKTTKPNTEKSQANAHLIAAAPDLFKGLRAMVVIASMYPEIYKQHQKEIEYYHTLLNKAEPK